MRIPNKPAKNVTYDPIRVCKSLEKEIGDLRKELSMYDTLTNRRQITYEPLSETQLQEVKGQVRKFVDGDIPEIEMINVRQVKQIFDEFKGLLKQLEKENEELRMKIPETTEEVNDTENKSENFNRNSLSQLFISFDISI